MKFPVTVFCVEFIEVVHDQFLPNCYVLCASKPPIAWNSTILHNQLRKLLYDNAPLTLHSPFLFVIHAPVTVFPARCIFSTVVQKQKHFDKFLVD